MKRRLAVLIAPAAIVLLAGCADTVKPPALQFGDTTFTKDDLEEQLKGASANAQAIQQLGAAKTATGAWNAALVTDTLNNLVLGEAIHQEFVKAKLPAAKVSAETKTQIETAFGGPAEFAKLPKAFTERQLSISAEVDSLITNAEKKLGTPEAFYAKNKDQFPATVCSRHILVETADLASAAKKRIAGGEDFAAVAKEVSKDTGSGANGGDLGCTVPSSFVAPFAEALGTLPLKTVSDPVQTEFGFHIIEVTERKESSYESSKEQVQQALQQQASNTVRDAVYARMNSAKISVDSTLGVIDRSGELPQIVAPGTKVGSASKSGAAASGAAASGS